MENQVTFKTAALRDSYFIYSGGEEFQSRLVSDEDAAFDTVVQFIFGEMPDPVQEEDEFDEFMEIKNDFENKELWTEGGSVWETDFGTGYVVVVKVQSFLN